MAVGAAHTDGQQRGQASAQASQKDRDCADFANQRAAQLYFLSIGGPGSDPTI